MEALLVLLGLYLIGALFILPIWVVLTLNRHRDRHSALQAQVDHQSGELTALRAALKNLSAQTPPVTVALATAPAPTVAAAVTSPAVPPLAPPPARVDAPVNPPALPVAPAAPPPLTRPQPVVAPLPRVVYTPPPRQPAWWESINWEQFLGAKLFAWLGGLALFLGVAYFVKYSFEHDLIPPVVRVAIGFVLGTGLIVGGLKISRQKYAVTAQTLIGAGVVSLYAVTFACRSIYHFEFFGPVPTFLLMTLITATAFILAVRLRAQVVAILGILGGFLTPVLLSTGQNNPAGLFGYLALLDAGLIAVVLATGWRYLVPLSAAGTALMLMGWTDRFFTAEQGPVAMIVCLGFSVLYGAANELARRREQTGREFSWTAAALPLLGLGFGFFFLGYPALAVRAPVFLGYLLLLDGLLLALSWRDETLPRLHLLAGGALFALLSLWTTQYITNDLLPWALALALGFAALHTAFPLLLERRRPESGPTWWSQVFPPLTLLFLLIPITKLPAISLLIWPAILLVDVLAIGLAALTASLAAVGAVLVLTLVATACFLMGDSAPLLVTPSLLLIIGGFAIFFFAASLWLVRRLGHLLPADRSAASSVLGDARSQLPAMAALLPFLLLIMVCIRLAVPDPSAIFGLGLLLTVLTLGLARVLVLAWLPACALAGLVGLQFTWHDHHFQADAATTPLLWYLGFHLLFAIYPFLFRSVFARLTGPWVVAALSGVAQFWLVYQTIKLAWPNDFLGLVPALFAAVPLVSLLVIVRTVPADNPARLNQLAWFGGVALLFITLIFPIQFERQWLTVAWALEGVALLWFFHRVPHRGLQATGAVLLVVAFARLALNPAVLGYHVRGDTGILNWYLYAYGLTTAALFLGARLLAPPRDQVLGVNAPPLLNTLGVILAFLLLNLEITDYFTAPGARSLAFQFSGNFARDMTYTIAWALFALGLLGGGIWQQTKAARYAAIALLSVALLKLFFHDLAELEALYRIGALFAVAVIAMLASFAYQRFLPSHEKSTPPPSA